MHFNWNEDNESIKFMNHLTWACVPSGKVITGLFGSTWTIETVPSGLAIVCTTPDHDVIYT